LSRSVVDAGRLERDERVLVVDSFAAGRRWARQADTAEPTWHPADDPYGAALVGIEPSRRGRRDPCEITAAAGKKPLDTIPRSRHHPTR